MSAYIGQRVQPSIREATRIMKEKMRKENETTRRKRAKTYTKPNLYNMFVFLEGKRGEDEADYRRSKTMNEWMRDRKAAASNIEPAIAHTSYNELCVEEINDGKCAKK